MSNNTAQLVELATSKGLNVVVDGVTQTGDFTLSSSTVYLEPKDGVTITISECYVTHKATNGVTDSTTKFLLRADGVAYLSPTANIRNTANCVWSVGSVGWNGGITPNNKLLMDFCKENGIQVVYKNVEQTEPFLWGTGGNLKLNSLNEKVFSASYLDFDGVITDGTLSTNSKTLTFYIKSTSDGTELNFNIVYGYPINSATGVLITNANESNCDVYFNNELKDQAFSTVLGGELKIIARDGWNIKPHVVEGNINSGSYISYIQAGGLRVYEGFTLNEYSTEGVISLGSVNLSFDRSNIESIQTAPVNTISPINNVYKLDDDIIKDVMRARFKVRTSISPANYDIIYNDYGNYIINLLALPFSIPESVVLEPDNIQLANYVLDVKAPILNTDRIVFNLGEISIPSVNNNSLDFNNVLAVLNLPYTQPIQLDLDYVIGQTVKIEYELNCYTGVITVRLYSTKQGDVFYTNNFDLGVNVPLVNLYGKPEQLLTGVNTFTGDNLIKTPYINIVDTNNIINKGFWTTPVKEDIKLIDVEGFFTVEYANLQNIIGATRLEKETIMNVLRNGVIK